MKVLVVHTNYQLKGGEDHVFEAELELLRKTPGVEVMPLTFQNKGGMKGAIQFLASIWNIAAAGKLKKAIREFKPDIIHLHNLHFGAGPIAVRTAKKAGVPVIVTLHNFRMLCPSGILLHDNKLFLDSVHAKFPWKAVKKKVYRGSSLQTFWLAFVTWFHKKIGTWKKVDRYIVLYAYARQLFIDSSFGIPAEKFVLKPNFKAPAITPPAHRNKHLLFIGRLSEEKGVRVLCEAFGGSQYELYIAGDGPLKQLVLDTVSRNKNIKYIGGLDREGVEQALVQCDAFIMPSVCYEGIPLTVMEAFSLSTPVIASDNGTRSHLVKHGFNLLHFTSGDAADLLAKVDYWQNLDEEQKETFRRNAYSTYTDHYTPEINQQELIAIYKESLAQKSKA